MNINLNLQGMFAGLFSGCVRKPKKSNIELVDFDDLEEILKNVPDNTTKLQLILDKILAETHHEIGIIVLYTEQYHKSICSKGFSRIEAKKYILHQFPITSSNALLGSLSIGCSNPIEYTLPDHLLDLIKDIMLTI